MNNLKKVFREATIADILQIQAVRNSVYENVLSNPHAVTDKDCELFLTVRGKGWVCEINNRIVGFSIVDLKDNNIWALFVNPEYEKKGIGRRLHNIMLEWYFNQGKKVVWLGTDPNTRAAEFYRKSGWTEIGKHGDNEIKFEITREEWSKNQ